MMKIIWLILLLSVYATDAFSFTLFYHTGDYGTYFSSYYDLGYENPYDHEEGPPYIHWNSPQLLPFNVNSNGCSGLNFNDVRDAIEAGFQAWDDIDTSISFTYYGTTQDTLDATDNMTTVSWGTCEGWTSSHIAITLITYNTSTGVIGDVDIFLNALATFSLNENYSHDIQAIITHEVGHLLGIGHSDLSCYDLANPELYQDEWPTMWAGSIWGLSGYYSYAYYQAERRSLAQDDIDAIEYQYGGSKKPAIPHITKENENSISVFPNPVNPVTTISYSIAEPSHVTLTIFSISGKKVATIVDDYNNAGIHTARFDGSNFASGIYFYQLNSKSFSKTGKLMLLK